MKNTTYDEAPMPEWECEARKAGWIPPEPAWMDEARRHGWRPPGTPAGPILRDPVAPAYAPAFVPTVFVPDRASPPTEPYPYTVTC